MKASSVIIVGIALVHLYWGVVLTIYSGAMKTTAIFTLARFGGHVDVGVGLVAVAVAAICSTRFQSGRLGLAYMMPQQMVLITSASAAVRASALERYADSTVAPGGWAQVSTDQAPLVLLALLHLFALLHLQGYLAKWVE